MFCAWMDCEKSERESFRGVLAAIRRGDIPGVTTIAAAHAQTQVLLEAAHQRGLRDGEACSANPEELRQVREDCARWRERAGDRAAWKERAEKAEAIVAKMTDIQQGAKAFRDCDMGMQIIEAQADRDRLAAEVEALRERADGAESKYQVTRGTLESMREAIKMASSEVEALRAQVASKEREYDRGFKAASTVCDIEIQHLRGLLREARSLLCQCSDEDGCPEEVYDQAQGFLRNIDAELGGEDKP
jgi:chromosome segregation ATPase